MERIQLPGGDAVERRVEAAARHLSHAYILSGPPGSGKHELAQHLAAAYVCSGSGERPCGSCSGCRKVRGDIHPDVIRLAPPEGKRSILVDQVRALRGEAYIRPNEAQRKVFVIEDAQAMNESAQNALLKVLEDGPAYLAFLLLTEDAQQLLPTIRSRCETLSLAAAREETAADEELLQQAQRLAQLLTAGEERALVEYTVELESKKWSREDLLAFFDAVEDALRAALPDRPRQVLPLLERLKQIRAAAELNVGAGHLLGWLAAGR
jgi:DNA polymerase-3 subunit delta'